MTFRHVFATSRIASARSIILAAPLFALASIAPEPPPLRGFTARSAAVERDWEAKFRAMPEPKRLRDMMQRLSAHPHHVGTR